MEKIEECVGEFLVAVSFRNVEEQFIGLLRVFLALMQRSLTAQSFTIKLIAKGFHLQGWRGI